MSQQSSQQSHLKRVRTIADYQFGRGAGEVLFPDTVEFQFSTTKRVRQILLDKNRIATVRARDGMLTLSIMGARRLHAFMKYPGQRVAVNGDAAPFVAKGKTAFARHVVAVDPDIRAGEEVLVVDENDKLLATGKAVLSPLEMLSFKKGIAVDVRNGIESGDRAESE
ncbi:MAG: pseudouridine synthase [Euryarchaeota archaeon]|nr:pseudouridine synthase [Euryarchaeota archaeon]MBU4492123.1 pseudouridine synthase [Euryarchaeota archaeon]MCG2728443.1 pseudouridine synthase [Candidatus Methanoperedenaceae archaeon]